MLARIYQPARNAMQSGQAKTRVWVLEFDAAEACGVDPLMGWTSSADMNSQVRLIFDSKQAAQDYAQENGIAASVTEPQKRKPIVRPGGYAENFATNRRVVWTH